jgi:lipid-binding SYLF domain-containing protein
MNKLSAGIAVVGAQISIFNYANRSSYDNIKESRDKLLLENTDLKEMNKNLFKS